GHRTRRRARARRDGGDGRRERHRLTGDTGVGTGGERERGRRARLVHTLGNGTRGTGREVRVAAIDRRDRLRADSQAAGAEGGNARAEGDGAVGKGGAIVVEGHRTRRRARARRGGGDGRRERHRLTGDTGVGTGGERERGRRARLVHTLGNDTRGTGSEVRVAEVDRPDRVRGDRQSAGAESCCARGESFGADLRGADE